MSLTFLSIIVKTFLFALVRFRVSGNRARSHNRPHYNDMVPERIGELWL